MIVEVTTGHENWRDHSAKFHVFLSWPFRRFRTTAGKEAQAPAEVHIGIASREGQTVAKLGPETTMSARNGRSPDEVGKWTRATYEAQEGAILKLFAVRKSGGFGIPQHTASQYIRLRSEAALRRISMPLSADSQARLSEVSIMSRFDLITFDEAKAAGAATLDQFRAFFAPALVDRLLRVEEIEPEISRPVVVEHRAIPREGNQPPTQMPVRRRLRALIMS